MPLIYIGEVPREGTEGFPSLYLGGADPGNPDQAWRSVALNFLRDRGLHSTVNIFIPLYRIACPWKGDAGSWRIQALKGSHVAIFWFPPGLNSLPGVFDFGMRAPSGGAILGYPEELPEELRIVVTAAAHFRISTAHTLPELLRLAISQLQSFMK